MAQQHRAGSVNNKAIVDIRLRPRCVIPQLPSRPIGRIACAHTFSEADRQTDTQTCSLQYFSTAPAGDVISVRCKCRTDVQ